MNYRIKGHFPQRSREIYQKLTQENKTIPELFLFTDAHDVKYIFEGLPVEGWVSLEASGKVIYWGSPLWVDAARKFLSSVVEIREKKELSSYIAGKVIAIDERTSVAFREELLKATEKVILTKHKGLKRIRMIKREDEIEKIKTACQIATEAFQRFIKKDFKEGISEKEASRRLKIRLFEAGAEQLAFEPIVAFGENTSYPHHFPTEKTYTRGEPAMFDWGAVYRGYHSDITRTLNAEKLPWFEIYMKALNSALEKAQTQTPACEVHKAAAEAMQELAEFFPHGTGHGVGVEIHEFPNLTENSQDILLPGEVFTVEPGIYKPDKAGVRIENTYLLSEKGLEKLSPLPEIL